MFKKFLTGLIFLISCNLLMAVMTVENGVLTDSSGNKIDFKEYKKIVVLDPAAIETIFMIGGENNITAIGKTARSRIYPEEKVNKLPSVGHISNINLEELVSHSPDLVISFGMSSKIGENLKTLNIPFITTGTSSFEEILENIKIYGVLTGREDEAEKLYNSCLIKLKNIKNKTAENPLNLKGLVVYSTSPMMAFNSKTLPGQILKVLGVKDLSEGAVGDRPIISPEYLLQENPDFIAGAMAISSADDILNSNPVIKDTVAGKNNNIFIIDSTKILRGSPRIFDTIEELYNELKNIKK